MTPIPVSLAVEGPLDEQVLRQLLQQSVKPFAPGVCYGRHGKKHLRQNIARFNYAAVHTPFFVLVDLDYDECPPSLMRQWLPEGANRNLVFRIVVREIEAWLLADRRRFAEFLGVSVSKVPFRPEECDDPKLVLINLARQSRKRNIRDDIPPLPGSTSKIGKNYVGQLAHFVTTEWRVNDIARSHSPSLDDAIRALEKFVAHFS